MCILHFPLLVFLFNYLLDCGVTQHIYFFSSTVLFDFTTSVLVCHLNSNKLLHFKICTNMDQNALSYNAFTLCQLGNSFRKIKFRSPEMKSDQTMARRMTLIVLTDFFCWVPIILLGVASLLGAKIEPQVSIVASN